MDYRPLGRTGVQVSPLCLGAMMFGPWGNDDRTDSIRIIHRALDAGINFVDTADVYSGGVSEEIVGEALHGRRDDVVLATKFFMPMSDDPNQRGGSRRWIMREVENSLRRLKTDYIDLYQVHRPSPDTDVAGDARRPHRPRPAGQGPLPRLIVVLGLADRRGAVGVTRSPPGKVRHRAAAVLDPDARHRGGRAPYDPAARDGLAHVQPVGWRMAVGAVAQGCGIRAHFIRPARRPFRHEQPRQPAQARHRRGARPARRTRPASASSSWRSPSSSTTPR